MPDQRIAERIVSHAVSENGRHASQVFRTGGLTRDLVRLTLPEDQSVQAEDWHAPVCWDHEGDAAAAVMTLRGRLPVDPEAPASQPTYDEAGAVARWAGKRLPTKAEWEVAAGEHPPYGNTLGEGYLRPVRTATGDSLTQMFGDVWEWTQSPYSAYPGFGAPEGVVGEYNGKFMCNQMVLRGGSCATADEHVSSTYQNFFYPHQRWRFSGVRLAEDAA